MKHKTNITNNEEFHFVSKAKEENYKIKFKQSYVEKHFDVEVLGWDKYFVFETGEVIDHWVTFRRIENENGEFNWIDWLGGNAKKEISLFLEKWYQKNKTTNE